MSDLTMTEGAELVGRLALALLPKRYAYMVIVVQNDGKGGSDQTTATNIPDKETIAALLRSIAEGLETGAFQTEYGEGQI